MRTIFYILLVLTPFLCHVVDKRRSCKTPNIQSYSGKNYLSPPTGQYSVGFIDLMTEGEPEDSVFMRIHYPTDANYLLWHERWPLWIPEQKYITGFYTFLQSMAKHWPSWLPRDDFLFSELLNPLFRFVPEFGFKRMFQKLFESIHVPIIENAPLAITTQNKTWPLIVFSHGIGQSRFLYSHLCSDLASYGFIVASTEHRDRSGCMSKYNIDKKVIWIPYLNIEKDANEYDIRHNQIRQRSRELSKTLDIMTLLNAGKDVINVYKHTPVSNPNSSVLRQFKESMNIEHPFIAGQSFGGSSIILTLLQDNRFKAGVSMDPWMYPLKNDNILRSVSQPLLFINSESFQYSQNQEKVLEFRNSSVQFHKVGYFIKGSVHQTVIDYAFLFESRFLKQIMGLDSITCPEIVLNINNAVTIQFLNENIERRSNIPINSVLLIKDGRFHVSV